MPEGLLGLENVVLTPHIASNTEETMAAMGECVVDNLAPGSPARVPARRRHEGSSKPPQALAAALMPSTRSANRG